MSIADQLMTALLAEGAGDELIARISALLQSYDQKSALETAAWFRATFPAVFGSKTPAGMKDLKADAAWLHRYLDFARALGGAGVVIGGDAASSSKELAARWSRVKDRVPELVRAFSNEARSADRTVSAELKLDGVTYINGVGFSDPQLKKWATELNKVWGTVKGWRHRAIAVAGGLKVKLARPEEFTGSKTATGKYRSSEDLMFVRATPNVLKRAGGTYGAPDYILIHELGHRYFYKVGGLATDFEKPMWWTTKYSRNDGEAFPELFALGHFGVGIQRAGAIDNLPQKLDRFEKVMTGVRERHERGSGLWPDVQESEIGHLHLLPPDRHVKKARVKRGDRGEVIARGAGEIRGYRSTTRHKTVGGGF